MFAPTAMCVSEAYKSHKHGIAECYQASLKVAMRPFN